MQKNITANNWQRQTVKTSYCHRTTSKIPHRAIMPRISLVHEWRFIMSAYRR